VNNMQVLQGITIEDIQKILTETISNIKGNKVGTGILFFDTSYLYTFHVSDMDYISKLCKLQRNNNIKAVYQWHELLERWYNDQTVVDKFFNREIKPLQIRRNLDRIVTEGLEIVAGCLAGLEGSNFHYHAIGEGDNPSALPNDTQLLDEISRIDVLTNSDGGSVARDGSTLYFVGNHPASIASAEISESGIFDNKLTTKDNMLDHSVFDPVVHHDQFEDSAGSTTVVYMCGI